MAVDIRYRQSNVDLSRLKTAHHHTNNFCALEKIPSYFKSRHIMHINLKISKEIEASKLGTSMEIKLTVLDDVSKSEY